VTAFTRDCWDSQRQKCRLAFFDPASTLLYIGHGSAGVQHANSYRFITVVNPGRRRAPPDAYGGRQDGRPKGVVQSIDPQNNHRLETLKFLSNTLIHLLHLGDSDNPNTPRPLHDRHRYEAKPAAPYLQLGNTGSYQRRSSQFAFIGSRVATLGYTSRSNLLTFIKATLKRTTWIKGTENYLCIETQISVGRPR